MRTPAYHLRVGAGVEECGKDQKGPRPGLGLWRSSGRTWEVQLLRMQSRQVLGGSTSSLQPQRPTGWTAPAWPSWNTPRYPSSWQQLAPAIPAPDPVWAHQPSNIIHSTNFAEQETETSDMPHDQEVASSVPAGGEVRSAIWTHGSRQRSNQNWGASSMLLSRPETQQEQSVITNDPFTPRYHCGDLLDLLQWLGTLV